MSNTRFLKYDFQIINFKLLNFIFIGFSYIFIQTLLKAHYWYSNVNFLVYFKLTLILNILKIRYIVPVEGMKKKVLKNQFCRYSMLLTYFFWRLDWYWYFTIFYTDIPSVEKFWISNDRLKLTNSEKCFYRFLAAILLTVWCTKYSLVSFIYSSDISFWSMTL